VSEEHENLESVKGRGGFKGERGGRRVFIRDGENRHVRAA
jgi:hypothetical protein